MKARLIKRNSGYQLLLCNGEIKRFTELECKHFLESFDSPLHYAGEHEWDFPISMEEYDGETIAIVNNDGSLCIYDADSFRTFFSSQFTYLSTQEFADKHNRKVGVVKRLCKNGRIEGAFQKGSIWLIPENAPYPHDTRINE